MIAKDLTQRHFRTLGLLSDANDSEIKDAYLRLAREHHPDRNYGDPEAADRFKEIQLAYESISKRISKPKPKKSEQFPFITPESSKSNTSRLCGIACATLIGLTALLCGLFQSEWWLAKQHLSEPVASVPPRAPLPERTAATPSDLDTPPRLDTPSESRGFIPASDLGGTFEDLRGLEDGLIEDLIQASYSTVKPDTTPSSFFEERATPKLPEPTTDAAAEEVSSTVEYFHLNPDNLESWPNSVNYDHPIDANRDSDFPNSSSTGVSWESKLKPLDHFPSELTYGIGDELARIYNRPAQQLPMNAALSDYSKSGFSSWPQSTSTAWPPVHASSKSMPGFSNTASTSLARTIDPYGPRTSPALMHSVTTVHPRDWNYSSSLNRLELQRTPSRHWEVENSWSASLATSRPQESSFPKMKSRHDWSSPVDRHNFGSISRAEQRIDAVHSEASREIDASPYWKSVGEPGQVVSTRASYASPDKLKIANWHLRDGLANEGSKKTGWRGYGKSEPLRSGPQKWTAHSNRVEVHKTVLQPYASKAERTRGKQGVYHSVHANGSFNSTRSSSPAASKWQSPSSNW